MATKRNAWLAGECSFSMAFDRQEIPLLADRPLWLFSFFLQGRGLSGSMDIEDVETSIIHGA
jgi:hypothetical protein